MKKMLCAIVVIALVAIIVIVFINDRNNSLVNQDSFIRTLELPCTIEQIAVISAVGDSGGNGNHNTLRSVMLVRTELTRDALIDIFINLGFQLGFSPFNNSGNQTYPTVTAIIQPSSYQFNSPRNFRLDFEELKNTNEFDEYFFVEFIS